MDKLKGTTVFALSWELSYVSFKEAGVGFDNDEPLGLIAQDPVLAQHVPYILSMNIGPITRPCIDTFLCNPSTSMEHLSLDREDGCTSKLQSPIKKCWS